jgi:hypothetical protein
MAGGGGRRGRDAGDAAPAPVPGGKWRHDLFDEKAQAAAAANGCEEEMAE